MPHIPTSIRAALGLAATAVAEARKLPETLPQLPVTAISTAMQASLRVQQHIATYAARGDEVISLLRGTSPEPPSWATFDDAPDTTPAAPTTGFGTGRPTAAFDRVQAEPAESASIEDAGADLGGEPGHAEPAHPTPAKAAPVKAAAKKAAPAKKAPAEKAPPAKATAENAPAEQAPAKKAPAKKAPPRKQTPTSEPLEEAAKKADPSGPPTPSTMAAEILHAHEAEEARDNHPQTGPDAGPGPDGAPADR